MASEEERRERFRVDRREAADGTLELFLSGALTMTGLLAARTALDEALGDAEPSRLRIDLSELSFLDTAGAFVVADLRRRARQRDIDCELVDVPPAVQDVLDLLQPEALTTEPIKAPRAAGGLLETIGRASISTGRRFLATMSFLGRLVLSALGILAHPRRLRPRETLSHMGKVGLDGLLLVGTISFLMGVVIALMAFDQLRQHGGVSILPSVVTMAMVKQFGPLITAILVAGRSGSAFAAEIATMQINEEIDALRIMGIQPVPYLALPRVLAAIVVVPILSIYADFSGVVGGLVVGVADAGLSASSFLHEIPSRVDFSDLAESLVKAAVFGLLLAIVGCQRGFRAERGAEAVGGATTSAVVSAIFLILFADATAALIVSRLGL